MNTVRNIPGFWTSLFHWAGCMFFIGLLPKRVKGPLLYFLSAVLLILQTTIYVAFIADRSGLYFNVMTALFALWTLVPFLLLSSDGLLNLLYYCARAFILSAFGVSLGWQFYTFYIARLPLLSGLWGEAAFMLAVALGVFTLAYLLERPHLKADREMQLRPNAVISAILAAVAIYIISSISYASPNAPFSASSDMEIYALRTLAYFGGSALMFAIHLQLCDTYSQRERSALQSILDTQYQNYRAMQDAADTVNQKYHDLKHQLALLRSEIGSGKRLEYLDQIEREISAYEARNKTGNEVLDTILTGKSQYCLAHDISFTCMADGHALDFMTAMDLSALFGNALDNAIESVMKIEQPEQRLISLSVSRQRRFVSVIVRNRYRDPPVIRRGLPVTTKEEKLFHGYGVKSIRSTAEKYGGTASVNVRDGWFELSILVPLTNCSNPHEAEKF